VISGTPAPGLKASCASWCDASCARQALAIAVTSSH
jgi:hypothetical protein